MVKKLTTNYQLPTTAAKPLIVIVGETASGKSALAMDIARRFNGEIICADSRTVYRELNIGTAKPSESDQLAVKHHLIDVVAPDEYFSAAEFQRVAAATINDISRRGKVPIMVGGTGLYIDSILYDFTFLPRPDPLVRDKLNILDVTDLQSMIREKGLQLPSNSQNPRHLIRVIETEGAVAERKALRANTLIIGLSLERSILEQRIELRVDEMFKNGLLNELMVVVKKYGYDCPALRAPGYRPLVEYLKNKSTIEEARLKFIKNDLNLAKRQRTWFRKNNSIQWLTDPIEAVAITTTFLNTKSS